MKQHLATLQHATLQPEIKTVPIENPLESNGTFLKPFYQLAADGANLQPLKKLFGNYILEKNIVLFPSERGTGKTWLGLQLSEAIANEAESFLGEDIELHGNVAYFNMEMSEERIKQRLAQLRSEAPFELKKRYKAYCYTSNVGDLFNNIDTIEHELLPLNPVLIVVDNLRTAFSEGNHEKNADATRFIKRIKSYAEKHNVAVLLMHHLRKKNEKYSSKISSDSQSGAGALTDLVDADFFLIKDRYEANQRFLKRNKSRNAEETTIGKIISINEDSKWFEVVEDDVEEDDFNLIKRKNAPSEEELHVARSMRGEGHSLQKIADKLGKNKSTISRWLNN